MNPYTSIQALIRYKNTEKPSGVIGTCFRIQKSNQCFITAHHCINGINKSEIKILNATPKTDLSIHEVIPHPKADIAVLVTEDIVPNNFEQFQLTESDFFYGAPAHCFGYTCDFGGRTKIEPRALVAFVQREFTYKDGQYNSKAIEISSPIPKGMSGGPVFYPPKANKCEVFGVAIASIESQIVVHSLNEYKNEIETEREKISKVIEYGVVLRLASIKDWLLKELKGYK